MRKISLLTLGILVLVFMLLMCDNPSGSESKSDHQYKLTVNVRPDKTGTVSPGGGTYDEGEQVALEASSSEGWQFSNWSGSVSSTNNPLQVIITDNMTITANFAAAPKPDKFSPEIKVADGTQSRVLVFSLGDKNGNSKALDKNDEESPPLAPPGTFFTGFIIDGMNLYKDYRPVPENGENVIWEIRLERAKNRNMDLEWTINDTLGGSLKLVNDSEISSSSVNIDMVAESSHTVSDSKIKSLFIVYTPPSVEATKSVNNGKGGTHQNDKAPKKDVKQNNQNGSIKNIIGDTSKINKKSYH